MPGTVVTIGNFDGVHAGHAALIDRARKAGDEVVALSFDPHPATVLRPGSVPARLTTFEDRVDLLKGAGATRVERLEPTPELLATDAVAFAEWLAERHRPSTVVEGPDFRFGRGRLGDTDLLERLGRELGFGVVVVEPVEVALSDQTLVPAASSMLRWLIERGRVDDARRLLGREYEIPGTVVRGERRGRGIGFPTANIEGPCLVPADGVYAAIATLPDGRRVPAAASIGTKPTFTDSPKRVVEAYLLDAETDGDAIAGLPEYGWGIRLSFTAWLRDQARYAQVDRLIEQMHRDCERVRDLTPGVPA